MKFSASRQFFSHPTFLDKLMFTRHLGVMLRSGIPLAEAISTLEEQTKGKSFQEVLHQILQQINNGQTLAKALSLYPHVFDSLYINLIEIGEKSGKLEENLDYLALHLSKNYEFRKKIQGAMLYPAIVLLSTLIIGLGLSFFVLPKLVDLFASLDVTLPLSTRILLFAAGTMKNYGVFIGLALTALFLLTSFLLQLPKIKPLWHVFLLKIPLFGGLLQNVELSTICRNLGIMLKSGLPITTTLEAESKALTNLVYREYLQNLLKSVDKGKTMEETLSAQKFSLIPHYMIKMIGVGEKTGKLEDTFIYLGDFFEEEVDNTTKNLANILEPVLLIIIGLVVAFVALAIISPIYELTGSIRR
ncbi:MAG: Type II secretion system protein [Candidatus Daviesbacteria bacterium GW2011_GWA1_41_61]|uniref:Type II secretion system protein n=1 Tax=Candidatus Daviesbacteria bacterium GW2011_GWA2_40_9 TaxID=1618424 RepID=A0A0G0TZ58_9BACT|nr:MAG: MSHA biogenesis protein MshG [Candidatus Daviesbacteria bacterium GW2011_GWC1_40_9]KKR82169.1 MAG: Type II secretion system protein [Candidatus Daviesbacteria bacterium GW2011_GWA2_40_9]KKR93639.1 MAG: Type II secretion system protein [Candidatus Daviesbacteria bacterium GW2011_GWB1_41_15]KKS14810.1 MAG: Type II secretion system protein [Candidatus Daviesbacteria bacterium GW2011_GWA1_41_61]